VVEVEVADDDRADEVRALGVQQLAITGQQFVEDLGAHLPVVARKVRGVTGPSCRSALQELLLRLAPPFVDHAAARTSAAGPNPPRVCAQRRLDVGS